MVKLLHRIYRVYKISNTIMRKLTLEQTQGFGKGLMRWIESGVVTMDDMLEGRKIYRLLACLIENPHKDSIDSNFNGMSFQGLSRYLNMANLDNQLLKSY